MLELDLRVHQPKHAWDVIAVEPLDALLDQIDVRLRRGARRLQDVDLDPVPGVIWLRQAILGRLSYQSSYQSCSGRA